MQRELTPQEIAALRSLGQHGAISPALRRLVVAMAVESGRAELTADQKELVSFYLRYPDELARTMHAQPARTDPYVLCAAAIENYLLRNDGRMAMKVFYTGPRHPSAPSIGVRA